MSSSSSSSSSSSIFYDRVLCSCIFCFCTNQTAAKKQAQNERKEKKENSRVGG